MGDGGRREWIAIPHRVLAAPTALATGLHPCGACGSSASGTASRGSRRAPRCAGVEEVDIGQGFPGYASISSVEGLRTLPLQTPAGRDHGRRMWSPATPRAARLSRAGLLSQPARRKARRSAPPARRSEGSAASAHRKGTQTATSRHVPQRHPRPAPAPLWTSDRPLLRRHLPRSLRWPALPRGRWMVQASPTSPSLALSLESRRRPARPVPVIVGREPTEASPLIPGGGFCAGGAVPA